MEMQPLPDLDDEALSLLCQAFKALAEPHRMKIFQLLLQGAQCNCSLGETLNIANNLLSHHLKTLREANLINIQRDPEDSRWIYYSINQDTLRRVHQTITSLFNPEVATNKPQSCVLEYCKEKRSRTKKQHLNI